jgi:hypothetical protein
MATFVEEIAHVFLGHRPTKIMTGLEREAYAVGAAVLGPYAALFLALRTNARYSGLRNAMARAKKWLSIG